MKVNIPCKFSYLEKGRGDKDKKGGGLLLIYKHAKHILAVEEHSENPDILISKLCISKFQFKLFLVYLATGDYERTSSIISDLEKLVGMEDIDSNYLILGDFNAHLGFLGPQKIDREGRLVLDLVARLNLAILNCDLNCQGEITWSSRGLQSSIDFLLASTSMHQKLCQMKIDECKEEFDLSDHNLITAVFEFQRENNVEHNVGTNRKWIYKTDQSSLLIYGSEVRQRLRESDVTTIGELNNIMIERADCRLKKEIKTGTHQYHREEKSWFNTEIKEAIRIRKMYNRKKRNEKNEELREMYNRKYVEAKEVAQRLVYQAVTLFELEMKRNISEEKDLKKVWKHINKLKRGGKREVTNQVTVYDEMGQPLENTKKRETFADFWEKIYQKHENDIEEEWNEIQKFQYEENFKKEKELADTYEGQLREHLDMCQIVLNKKMKVMTECVITEPDLERQIMKMKTGKAAGPDGL